MEVLVEGENNVEECVSYLVVCVFIGRSLNGVQKEGDVLLGPLVWGRSEGERGEWERRESLCVCVER